MARLRRILPLVLVLAGLLVPACAQAAGPQAGLVVTLPLTSGELQRVQESGVKVVRFFAYENVTAVNAFDGPIAQLRAIGVKPIVVVVGDISAPPVTDVAIAQYASWMGQAAAHYRGEVLGWEIWNEEDASLFWAGASAGGTTTTDASAYVRLLKAAHDAIRASDPTTPIVLGGLTGNDYRFLQSVYDNGGGPYFDVVADHTDIGCNLRSPYDYYRDQSDGRISQWVFLGYRSLHDVMVAHGDAGKPIWMTELGWSTTQSLCDVGSNTGLKPGGVSEADQATFLTEAFHCLAQDPYVQQATVFRLEDGTDGSSLANFGLVHADDSLKPGFTALSTYAHRGDTLPASEACGDFDPPAATVTARYPADLLVHMTAADPSGVVFVDLFVDGKQVRHFFNATYPTSWSGDADLPSARAFAPGTHTIVVRATDFRGNVGTTTLTVVKGKAGAAQAVSADTGHDQVVTKSSMLRSPRATRRAARRPVHHRHR